MAFFRGEVLAAILALAQAPAKAADVAQHVLADSTYQTQLPKEVAQRVLAQDHKHKYQAELPEGPPPPDFAPPESGGFSLWPLFRLIAYVAVAIALALGIFWLVRRFGGGGDADVAVPDDAAPAPLDVEMAGPERLAAAGRYAEAIHELLLETLAAVSRAGQLPPSYTSREILERVRLPARAREALSGLVVAVEVSRFGGLPAVEADYRICLDRFHAFLESYHRPTQEAAA